LKPAPPAPAWSAEQFSTLFEFLPIGAYRTTPDGRQVRANPALVRMNGFADEAELMAMVSDIGNDWYVQPGRREEFKARMARDGRVAGFESEVFRYKTRERIWVSENAHIVRDADGQVLFYEGTVEDITDRVRDREALRRSEQQLRQIVDLVPGVSYRVLTSADGVSTVDFISPNVEDMLGLKAEALLADSRAVHRLRHPDDQARVAAEIREAFDAQRPLDVEYRILRPDGREVWIQQTNRLAPPEHGCEVRIGLLLDITARKCAEAGLRDNSELWKRALESSGDGVWDWHIAQGIEQLSPACKALYGFEPDELPDTPDALDSRTHPDDLPGMRQAREDHFAGRTARYVNEHRVQCKDGQWKWILSRGIVIARDASGRPLRMIGTHTDVTARRQAEDLRIARDRAEAADLAKSQFLSRVSHELRTPLNAIMGFSQLLELETSLPPRQRGWVQQVLGAGHHLLGLMDDILDLSSAQTGELRVVLQAVELAPLLAEVGDLLGASAEAAGLVLRPQPLAAAAPAGLRLNVDRKRLKQVLVNLLANAIKYHHRAGQPAQGGWVRLRVATEGGDCLLHVVDNGPGLTESQCARLFRPFERLGAQGGPVPGSGLGLALSRQLTEAMGGQIGVSSRLGEGSTFTVRLPIA
jgi:PAS domain S-box-containing protein